MNHDKIMEIHWKCHMKARRQQCVDTEYLMNFAELIIKDCVDIANKQFTAATGLDDRDSWTATEIKKHFGVKE